MRAVRADHLARRSPQAVRVLRSAARAVSPLRVARALRQTGRMRRHAEHPEWIEQRFACDDPGAATTARRVVGEVLGGRVATSVVKRAELERFLAGHSGAQSKATVNEVVVDILSRTKR